MTKTRGLTQLDEHIERLSAARAELFVAIGQASSRFQSAPADGGWNVRQVCEHVADNENFFVRQLARILDVDIWSSGPSHFGSPEEAVSGLIDAREMLLWALKDTDDDALSAARTLPRAGEFTIAAVLGQLASHDLDHAGQIRGLTEG